MPEFETSLRLIVGEDGGLGLEEFEDQTDRPNEVGSIDTSGALGMVFRLRPDISNRLIDRAARESKTESDLFSKFVRIYHLRLSHSID